jgi:ribosome biogenesis GTPase
MAKRRLSRQQSWRIEKIQAERAARAARRADGAQSLLLSGALGAEQEGLIIAHFGTQVLVQPQRAQEPEQDEDSPECAGTPPEAAAELDSFAPAMRCHLRANLDTLVTGDRVVFCAGEPLGVVVARLARHSLLQRPDRHGLLKPVAANIDQVVIVIAPLPAPHAALLDRYLVACASMGAQPLIVINKCDLLADPVQASAMRELLAVYPGLGYRLMYLSAHGSLHGLQSALCGRISVLVGQSGVGKTSLVNGLLPGRDRRVGALSAGSFKGRHTTTTAELHHLPAGGALIDSPGIREFGLDHLPREEVAQGFVEFRAHLGHCRFRNCEHREEPGCALLAAVDRGQISAARFSSYRHILGLGAANTSD